MPRIVRSPRVYTFAQWQEIIEEFTKSGLNQSQFCKQKELTPSAFYNWRKKLLSPNSYQPKAHRTYSFEEWKELIAAWEKGDLSKPEFCEQQGITLSAFYYWENIVKIPNSLQSQERGRRMYTLEEQKSHVDDWRKSGLSKSVYSVQKNLIVSTLDKWIRKFNLLEPVPKSIMPSPAMTLEPTKDPKENSTAFFQEHFVPVSLDSGSSNTPSFNNQRVEVTFADGHRLCLQGAFDLELLGSWLTPLLTK